MQDFFIHLAQIKEYLSNKPLLLLLDFDGTLSPIAVTPQAATIPPKTLAALLQLEKNPQVHLAIISGRALSDLRQKIPSAKITLAGNHGLEWIYLNEPHLADISQEVRHLLPALKQAFTQLTQQFPGTFVEDKHIAATVHFRSLPKALAADFKQAFKHVFAQFTPFYMVLIGKKAFDVRPRTSWNKGTICQLLISHFQKSFPNLRSIYIGDDATDEDAFKTLFTTITVRVGKNKHSHANYYLTNQRQVVEVLSFIRSHYENRQ